MALVSSDFLETNAFYEDRESDCLFCNLQKDDRKRIIAENNLAYAIRDGFPVTEGHTLFIPKRHIADYFGLVPAEVSAINLLMAQQKQLLHLIPRRKGDVENPRGGVRHIIAGKGFYEEKK